MLSYWVNDVAEPLEHKDWSDEIRVTELVEGLHTGLHEGQLLLLSPGCQVFQHLKQQVLALIYSLRPLHHQSRKE